MYKFEFELTEEDFVNYNMYFFNTSKSSKRAVIIIRVLSVFLVVLIPMLLVKDYTQNTLAISLIVAMIPGLFFGLIIRVLFSLRLKKIIRKTPNSDLLGERKLEFTNSGIVATMEKGTSQYRWSSVSKIEETLQYIFVFVDNVQVILVPKRVMKNEGKEKKFVEYCMKKIERNKG